MRDRNRQPPMVVNPPTISYVEVHTNHLCFKTKADAAKIIFRGCCTQYNHKIPDFQLSLTNLGTIVHNYEAHYAYIKARVQDKYYLAAKTLIKGAPEHQLAQDLKKTSPSKQKNYVGDL